MATYTVDKIGYNNNEYVLQDSGALQLTGGSVTGPVTFSDDVSVSTINGVTVGSSPKFTDNNTTYSLSNALSSHKFTSTLTAGGSGSGTSTASIELVAGTGITLTDDTTNKKITIASSVTNTDTKVQVAAVTSGTTYYPIVGTGTTAATRQYDTTGFIYKGTNGTTSAVGSSILTLGNSTASGTANNKQGQLIIYGSTAYSHTIQGAPTANRTLTLPNATGTIALTSDIPSVPDVSGKIDTAGTGLSKSGTTLNHSNSVTAGTAGTSSATSGSTLAVPYVTYDAQGHITGSGTHTHTISGFATSDVNVTSTAVTAATTNYITGSTSSSTATGTLSKHASAAIYTTADSATSGYTQLRLGNATATSSAGGKEGQIRLYGTNANYFVDIKAGAIDNGTKTIMLPNNNGTIALTSNIPSAGTSASAVGTTASGGSASTYSKSDHVHNITSSTIGSAGGVTGITVNGTTISPTSGIVDIGTVATSDTKVNQIQSTTETGNYSILFTQTPQVLDVDNTDTAVAETRKSVDLTFIPRSGSNPETAKSGQLIVNQNGPTIGLIDFYGTNNAVASGNGFAVGTLNTGQNEIVATGNHGYIRARRWNAAKNADGSVDTSTNYIASESLFGTTGQISTTSYTMENSTISQNYQTLISPGSNWFCLHNSLYGVRVSQNGLHPYIEVFDGRSTSTGDTTYRLDASGIKKVNNFADSYHVAYAGSAVSLNNTNFNVMQSFKITDAGTYLISVVGMFPAIASSAIKIVRLTSNTSTDALTTACEATLSSTVVGNLNKACFTAIVNFTADTTYRIQMKTGSATNGNGYSAYSYVRLL